MRSRNTLNTAPDLAHGQRPSPEILSVRVPLHLLLRACNTGWCSAHPDGPLRGRTGRRVAAALAVIDLLQAPLLARGKLDTGRGRVARTVLDAAEVVAATLAYPGSGNEGGMATALLPAAGSAVERAYSGGARAGLMSLVAPTLAGLAARRVTRQPISVADVLTYPVISLGAVSILRLVENRGKRRASRDESRRRSAVERGSWFMGTIEFLEARGLEALDHVKHQLTLATFVQSDRDDVGPTLQTVIAERGRSAHEEPLGEQPELLATVLRRYELTRNRSSSFNDHFYLDPAAAVRDLKSVPGSVLLDAGQVAHLVRSLDRLEVGGDVSVEVVRAVPRGFDTDVELRVVAQTAAPRGEPLIATIDIPASRSPWRLQVVPAGIALHAGWLLSLCSPAHAHIPVRYVAPLSLCTLAAAAAAQIVVTRSPEARAADLAPLVLPGSFVIAVLGPRTMRRKTYGEGGTPFHPGLHALAGSAYLLGAESKSMTNATRAVAVAGAAATATAAWLSSRRYPGDGSGFVAELMWSSFAVLGSRALSTALRHMSDAFSGDLSQQTTRAGQKKHDEGWVHEFNLVGLLNEEAKCQVDRVEVEDPASRRSEFDADRSARYVAQARREYDAAQRLLHDAETLRHAEELGHAEDPGLQKGDNQ